MSEQFPAWNCPLCLRPASGKDQQYEYCIYCRGYTAIEPQPGFAWVKYVGGPSDNTFRIEELRLLEPGDERAIRSFDDIDGIYVFDGSEFVFDRDVTL